MPNKLYLMTKTVKKKSDESLKFYLFMYYKRVMTVLC